MIIMPAAILLIVVAAVGLATRPGRQDGHTPARLRLDTRLARGEITRDEYQQRTQVLTEGRPRQTRRGLLWTLGATGLVLLLLAGSLTGQASPGDGWWDWHGPSMAGHMGWNQTAAAPTDPPVSGAPERIVEAGDLWFEPDRIEIEADRTTNLVLDNTGQAFHDLSIPELDLRLEAQPGETVSTALRAPEAGSYEFTCTVPGHAAAGMRGELMVAASP
jgi:uncharacterized cupredoxin-like copper-binding protein